MRKLYTTKLINRPEMKFYLVLDYTSSLTSRVCLQSTLIYLLCLGMIVWVPDYDV